MMFTPYNRYVLATFLTLFICSQPASALPLPLPQTFIHLQPDYDFGGDVYQQWVRGGAGDRYSFAQVILDAPEGKTGTAQAYTSYSYWVGMDVQGMMPWDIAANSDFDAGVPLLMEWTQSLLTKGYGHAYASLNTFGIEISHGSISVSFVPQRESQTFSGVRELIMLPNNQYNVHLQTSVSAWTDTSCSQGHYTREDVPTYICDEYDHTFSKANYYAVSDPVFTIDPNWVHYDTYSSLITLNESLADVSTEEYGSRREAVPPSPVPAPAALWLLCIGLFALRISHGRKV